MSMNDDFSRSDRDGRSGPNIVMWVILVGALMALAGVWAVQNFREHIILSDLQKLIVAYKLDAQGELVPGSPGYIQIPKKDSKEKEVIRYSKLSDVLISDNEVVGKVHRQVYKLEETDGEKKFVAKDAEPRPVSFVTKKQ